MAASERENLALTSIRGIAALYVLGHHFNLYLLHNSSVLFGGFFQFGYTGVDLFFVLSGFIMAMVYWNMISSTIPEFWLKRICRLYPLHLTIMLSLAFLFIIGGELHVMKGEHSWYNFLCVLFLIHPYFVHNYDLLWNPPTWSISIELFCYILFPVMIIALRNATTPLLGLLLLGLGAAEFVVALRHGDGFVGIGAVLRGLSGFSLGVATQALTRILPRPRPGLQTLCEIAALAGIAVSVGSHHPQFVPLLSAVLIASLSFSQGAFARHLSGRVYVWLGQISFSIYLLHVPIVLIFERVLPMHRFPIHGYIGAAAYVTMVLALVLVTAHQTWRFIEQPGRRLPRRLGVFSSRARNAVV